MEIAQLHANVKTNNFVLFNLNYICVILKCASIDMGIYTTIQKFGIGKFFLFVFFTILKDVSYAPKVAFI